MASRVLPENFNICIQALVEGGYDLLLTYHHSAIPISLDLNRYDYKVVGLDSLMAVAASVEWRRDQLGRLPLLQYSRGSFLGRLASIAQSQAGAPATYALHTNENSMAEALRFMALAGHGIAWLPRSLVRRELAAGLLTTMGPELEMEIRLYRSADRSRAFLDAIWKEIEATAINYSASE